MYVKTTRADELGERDDGFDVCTKDIYTSTLRSRAACSWTSFALQLRLEGLTNVNWDAPLSKYPFLGPIEIFEYNSGAPDSDCPLKQKG